ncbi:hypothetical protein C3B79_2175 [Aeromonas hydrophila]|nr:hypothetical protein C3B79_2175 [Aeromonas hydrophila]
MHGPVNRLRHRPGDRQAGEGPQARELDEQGQRSLENMLLVWELPDPDEDYAIGADVAEGLEHGDRSSLE